LNRRLMVFTAQNPLCCCPQGFVTSRKCCSVVAIVTFSVYEGGPKKTGNFVITFLFLVILTPNFNHVQSISH
jgi:hypothetical protein